MATYSFADVAASIVGPGGSFSLGYGAGNSEEGITVEMNEDKDDMKVGADGAIMHSLRASRAGKVTVRLLKTSPVNNQLSLMYSVQEASSAVWGQNVIVVTDVVRGDLVSAVQMAFVKQSPVVYAKDGNMNEWSFQGAVTMLLGPGVPDVNV